MTPAHHSAEQIERTARRYEQLTDALDPADVKVEATDDLRAVASASRTVEDDEARLRSAVAAARAAGRSWNQIALALGVSRQAARQRFAERVHA